MHPVTIDDLMSISDEGGIMPPKSTWFEPKLRDGLLIAHHMKVLVADKFEKSGIDGLKAAGCDVVYEPDLKDDALTAGDRRERRRRAGRPRHQGDDADARRRAAVADRPRRRRLQHDRRRRRLQRGIYVSNCPGKNAIAVAELAFGLILSLDRRIPDNVARAARRQPGTRRNTRRRRASTAGRSRCSASAASARR